MHQSDVNLLQDYIDAQDLQNIFKVFLIARKGILRVCVVTGVGLFELGTVGTKIVESKLAE